MGGVGIPAGVNPGADSHEFSGIVDFSGLLATDAWGSFVCSAGDGKCKRAAEATVPINDKMIVLGLQAHNHWGGQDGVEATKLINAKNEDNLQAMVHGTTKFFLSRHNINDRRGTCRRHT